MANVWDPVNQRWTDPATGNYLVGGQGNADGTWTGGTWTNPNGGTLGANGTWSDANTAPIGTPAQAQYNAQQGVYGAQQNQINANTATIAAQQANVPNQQAQINAQRNQNTAQGNVLQAQAGTFGPSQQVIGAKGNVIQAQSQYTQAQQGFIGQEQAANQARIGDQNAIVAARNNTADQVAVGQYNNSVADIADRYANAGVSQPVRVATTDNQGGPLAPGVIGDVRTQETRVTQNANDRETLRAAQLQGAQLAVSLIGTNVDLANQAAARAGLTLEQAQLVVSEAQNAKGYADIAASNAGLNVNQGNLGVDQAKLAADSASQATLQSQLNLNLTQNPPFAGAVKVVDPNTGIATSWGTPAQAAQAQAQYQKIQTQQVNAAQLKQSGLFGGLSQSEMLNMLGNGILGPREVQDELVRRYNAGQSDGLTPQAANLLVQNYMQTHSPADNSGNSGGDQDLYGNTGGANPALPGTTQPGSQSYQDALNTLQSQGFGGT